MFAWFSVHPLWPTDLWDHVNYGEVILNQGQLPETEPLLNHVETQMTWTDWGSKALLAGIASAKDHGLLWLQLFHGSIVAGWVAVIGISVLKRTRSLTAALAACLVLVALNWQQIQIIRPQTSGLLFFAAVATRCSRTDFKALRGNLIGLPALFLIWCNLHGSFSVGLALLGITLTGNSLQTALRCRSVHAVPASRRIRLQALALGISIVVCLLNPAGPRIFADVLTIGRHPNIQYMFEWDALSLQMKQGKVFLAVFVALIPILIRSPRRLRIDRLLWLLLFGSLTVWSSRMINWYSVVASLVIAEHVAAIIRSRTAGSPLRIHTRTAAAGAAAGSVILLSIGLTGVLQRQQPEAFSQLARRTPIALGRHLQKSDILRDHKIFTPAEWSGYLMRQAPNIQPLAHLHVHLLPEQVWIDHLTLHYGRDRWQAAARQNDLSAFVVDRRRNRRLIQALRKTAGVKNVWQDGQAAIYLRDNKPQKTP